MRPFMEDRHWRIVTDILCRYPYTFYVFGSRATGKHRRLSDLDLCYKDPIPFRVISQIAAAFEESDLPFTVDLVDWNTCSDEFRERIESQLQPVDLF